MRTLSQIACEIMSKWRPVHQHAAPYVKAMLSLKSIEDKFYQDDARDIVLRFLGNAASWRGEDARRVKAELKGML